jgi:DNA-binding MarR family transcriptional regulator
MSYFIYNALKYEVFRSIAIITMSKEQQATVHTIAMETGIDKKKIRSALSHYEKFGYIKKTRIDEQNANDKSLHKYTLTKVGESVFVKLHARVEKNQHLNLRKSPSPVEGYVRYSQKEINERDKATRIINRIKPYIRNIGELYNYKDGEKTFNDNLRCIEIEVEKILREAN